MKNKKQFVSELQQEFHQWETILTGLSEKQVNSVYLNSNWTIKDVVAHLMAWQQVTNARMDAALLNGEPTFPEWLAGNDPESEEQLENFNSRIYHLYKEQPWESVYQMWKSGYQKLLKTSEMITEKDLLETGKFEWLGEYPLSAILYGTYDHHHGDHLAPLLAYFSNQGN